ncbi:epoxide hydrolase [Patellaria atrata CBS 101060]|uniref:Epoxide hydrolase n=1 Tax=Patellaria atrata CBS 101060 TaxID=1346257 RepID=A0A9P4S161_9PEZI|nr:epoxide hydrolase [Patellaria atrata CBS 101060]
MDVDKIDPYDDSRVTHEKANVNGQTYHYILGLPGNNNATIKGTIFLIHGWPDLSIGWRYQIPILLEMGFRVVAPDMMGYGGTDAPQVPPAPLSLYGMKRAADDIAELARQLNAPKIVLGGHDWGGAVVWRAAMWHPELITHVFSVCTPFAPVHKQYISTEDMVKGPLPQFGYQLHLASPEVEGKITTKEEIRQFLNGMYGGKGASGELMFDPTKGIIFENLLKVGKSKLLTERELEYYVDQYHRNGLHGTVNWYRTREINWEEDQQLKSSNIDIPTLYVQAEYDHVLLPSMGRGMGKYLSNLTVRSVPATHWALTQKPQAVNIIIKEWIECVVLGGKSKL